MSQFSIWFGSTLNSAPPTRRRTPAARRLHLDMEQLEERLVPSFFANTANGIHVFEDQLPGGMSNALVQFTATHTDGTQKQTLAEINQFRAYNPGYTLLDYRLGTMAGPPQYIINGQWGSDFASTVNPNESWFLHQSYSGEPQSATDLSSGRIIDTPDNSNAMDISNSSWQNYWLTSELQNMQAVGANGVFADSFTYGIGGAGYDSPPLRYQGTNAANPSYWPGGITWTDQLHNWAQTIETTFQQYNAAHGTDYMLIPNLDARVTSWEPNWVDNASGVPIMDGAFLEGFGQWTDTYDWTLSMNRGLNFTTNNKIVIMQPYFTDSVDSATGQQERNFYLGTYLLLKGDETYINMGGGVNAQYYPEYQLNLGTAITPLPTDASSYLWNGVYRRDFQNGFVLVNPGSTSYTLDLGGTYQLVQGHGGGPMSDASLDANGNYIGGYLTYTNMSSITMAGGTAAIFLNPASPPAAPTNLAASAGNAQVTLSWSASTGAASYNVYRALSSGGEGATPIATGLTGTSFSDTGLSNGTTYYYEVTAVNVSGESGKSSEVSATPQVSAPAAPTNLLASAGNAQVALSWTASSGASSYDIYRGTSSGSEALVDYGITSASFTDTGLSNGTTYYYEVSAVNAGGESGRSNEVSATPQVAPPAAPTNLVASAGNAQVALSWTGSSGATSYNVYRGTASGAETLLQTGITTTSFTNSGLSNGTTYYYEVTAVDAGGESGRSNQVSATPQVPPPAAPTNLVASAGNAQVALSWAASSGATSYTIYRGTASGGESLLQAGITTTSFTNSGLSNGTTYYYQVTAVNAGGESGRSNQVSATPQAASTLPAPWKDSDIGSPGLAGSASYANGLFTVKGGGADIWNTSDQFNFAYRTLTGNGTIIARVNSQQNTSSWAKAGVMIRDSLSANGAYVFAFTTPGNGTDVQFRTSDGASAGWQGQTTAVAPEWLKIVRSGNTLIGYASSNGSTWTQLGSIQIGMPSTVYIGLAVTAHNNAAASTAVFSQVSVTATTTTPVSLSYNRVGIVTDGSTFAGGLDGGGAALSAKLLGSAISWNGQRFALGTANKNNVVSAQGQTIGLSQGNFSSLMLLADAVNGNQTNLTFTVHYTDGTSQTFTQSFSDWHTPQKYAGESIAATNSYRDLSNGTTQSGTFDVYGYAFALNSSKTVQSITLPSDSNLEILSMLLKP
jgi:fibronectin type 3 domain-containing protein